MDEASSVMFHNIYQKLLNLHDSDLAFSAHSEGGSTIYRRYDPKLVVLNTFESSPSPSLAVFNVAKLDHQQSNWIIAV